MEDILSDEGLHLQEILLAASCHDLETLKRLLELYSFPEYRSVDVQDLETGFSPLHAAIAACETDCTATSTDKGPNSALANGMSTREDLLAGVKETVKFLLENGAIWNQLDVNDETPGCIARRLGLPELYDVMVDAGVRAELLLNRLEGYERLEDEEDEDVGEENTAPLADVVMVETNSDKPKAIVPNEDVNSTEYLSSTLSLSSKNLLDDQQNGVMMAWESGIMLKSAEAILYSPGLRVLNIGFGMGIIDNYIQTNQNKPKAHHIVEAHPDVLAAMKTNRWHEKPGVIIHAGKWQEVLPQLVAEGQMFDAIYFDTFAESYSQFRDFFSEQVIGLLDQGGKWSFFNGMGADRQISYDVYQKVVEMDLFEAGFDLEWEEVEIPELDGEWEGVKRRYWKVESYRLPLCRFMD